MAERHPPYLPARVDRPWQARQIGALWVVDPSAAQTEADRVEELRQASSAHAGRAGALAQ